MNDFAPWSSLLGGLLIGLGVCGIARRSPRSLAATLTFVCAGAVTVFVLKHRLGGAA